MELKEFYKDKRILITGGLGFIGSNLAIRLTELAAKVTILDSLDKNCGGNEFNIEPVKDKVKIIKEDMRNLSLNPKIIKDQDIIFNLAAHISHKRSMENPLLDLSINTAGSLSLLESCRKNDQEVKIIYTGTRAQYGKIVQNPADENHPINFTDINGISKHTAENFHFMYHKLNPKIKVIGARLTNCYGPRHQMIDPSQGFVGLFIKKAMENETIELWGGDQTRDLNYVSDVVEALIMLGSEKKAEGRVFNVGSGKETSLKDLAEKIIQIAGTGNIEIKPIPDQQRKIEPGNYRADISRIKKYTCWTPKTNLEEGLKKTIEFYKQNQRKYW